MNTSNYIRSMNSDHNSPISLPFMTELRSDNHNEFLPEDTDTNSAISKVYAAFLTIDSKHIRPYQCILPEKGKSILSLSQSLITIF